MDSRGLYINTLNIAFKSWSRMRANLSFRINGDVCKFPSILFFCVFLAQKGNHQHFLIAHHRTKANEWDGKYLILYTVHNMTIDNIYSFHWTDLLNWIMLINGETKEETSTRVFFPQRGHGHCLQEMYISHMRFRKIFK